MESKPHFTPEQIDTWADGMLKEAMSDMLAEDIDVTPENLSEYFEREYQLPFTPYEAALWLKEQEYSK